MVPHRVALFLNLASPSGVARYCYRLCEGLLVDLSPEGRGRRCLLFSHTELLDLSLRNELDLISQAPLLVSPCSGCGSAPLFAGGSVMSIATA